MTSDPAALTTDQAMAIALEDARVAAAQGEVPVGCVIVRNGAVVARAANRVMRDRDATQHAELIALRDAMRAVGDRHLSDCTLVVTLEPCAMCAAAISLFRVKRVVFGAYDPKGGGVEHGPRFFAQPTCHHAPEVVGGLREAEAASLLREFFAGRR